MQIISDLIRQLMFRKLAPCLDFIVILEPMLFGQRLTQTRKQKNISQEQLASKLGVHAPVIGRYERGEVKPSIEVAIRIAKVLEVSLDFLSGLSDNELSAELIQQIDNLQSLPEEDQGHIIKTMQSLIRDAKARAAYG